MDFFILLIFMNSTIVINLEMSENHDPTQTLVQRRKLTQLFDYMRGYMQACKHENIGLNNCPSSQSKFFNPKQLMRLQGPVQLGCSFQKPPWSHAWYIYTYTCIEQTDNFSLFCSIHTSILSYLHMESTHIMAQRNQLQKLFRVFVHGLHVVAIKNMLQLPSCCHLVHT